eukprot:NODE_4880_length_749_cov_18.087143_g4525_i0.p1 GENE.NODE_4880_length_749_cov_18.087143_g4525_i0~~NODE_4880_length_749_cov_18.087143_g4525_i0.p1  ORF type:complete len:138 (+),score=8.14 NODE_4880_length_749_cov_18.087143_g4525_i0:138-551(+)
MSYCRFRCGVRADSPDSGGPCPNRPVVPQRHHFNLSGSLGGLHYGRLVPARVCHSCGKAMEEAASSKYCPLTPSRHEFRSAAGTLAIISESLIGLWRTIWSHNRKKLNHEPEPYFDTMSPRSADNDDASVLLEHHRN